MAATSGLDATLATDLLNHITPTTTPVATTTTITGPIMVALNTAVNANDASGAECADANYAQMPVTLGTASTTTGAGYGVGFVGKVSTALLEFAATAGVAVAQTLKGWTLYSSDGTPVRIGYANYAADVVIPINQKYSIAAGSCTIAMN